jgi:diacylglycerol kinase family enzyme
MDLAWLAVELPQQLMSNHMATQAHQPTGETMWEKSLEAVSTIRAPKSKAKQLSGRENYFLLTAGLGIDAAVISHTSKGLKQQVGRFAFDEELANRRSI